MKKLLMVTACIVMFQTQSIVLTRPRAKAIQQERIKTIDTITEALKTVPTEKLEALKMLLKDGFEYNKPLTKKQKFAIKMLQQTPRYTVSR